MKLLVVVDMQHDFETSHNLDTIDAVVGLINRADELDWNVILVEFKGYGITHPQITDAIDNLELGGYLGLVSKRDDCGSTEIHAELRLLDLDSEVEEFIMCGVNTTACVLATALGLSRLYPHAKITFALNACNQPRHWERDGYGMSYLESYAKHANSQRPSSWALYTDELELVEAASS